ncbi:hypothetical protein [Microbacterium cremeum]|uniref:hypothetical protein n=1 Tax=Microbacterium cremeum TaxID=2782169 RepID=UPI0018894E9C|nr:hypothetical protein [Microbacterium cremeum]
MPNTTRSPHPRFDVRPLILLLTHGVHWRRRGLPPAVYAILLAGVIIANLLVGLLAPSSAHAASRGAGFGTWAPTSAYGWHGSMLVDGIHTYCITPGAPLPTGPSTDNGVSGTARGLTPQQLTGINLLVTKYGQTDDPVQAAAVGWAVKATANWSDTIRAFGHAGDTLDSAIHWTLSRVAPEHVTAVQQLAVSFYDEAKRAGEGGPPSGAVVFTTDAGDHTRGTVRVDSTASGATGTLTLTHATFADTGTATRERVAPGVEYAIIASPPAEGRPYTVSASGRFSGGYAAAVRHYTTPRGQDTAGPGGALAFDVAGTDAAPRVPPFAPTITTQVATRYAAGGSYVDHVAFDLAAGAWPRAEDGSYLPVAATAVVHRTDAEPSPGGAVPAEAELVGALELTTDPALGPTVPYPVTSTWQMTEPGFYTAVWTIRGIEQTEAVARHTGADYTWTESFGERSQVTMVPAITTVAQPSATAGETISDTIRVGDPVPAAGLRVESAVYRAVAGVSPGETCVDENLVWRSDPVPVTAPGDYVVTSPPIDDPGTYYWQERAADAEGSVVHIGVCGIENETTTIAAASSAAALPRPALAATGAGFDALRPSAAIAVCLLTAGATLLAVRSSRFGPRAKIR